MVFAAVLLVFASVFFPAAQEVSASSLSEMTDVEKAAYYSTTEGQTIYALLNWMASDDYTGTLSDTQLADVEYALNIYDSCSWVEDGSVDISIDGTALQLKNVEYSLDLLDEVNELRASDENYEYDHFLRAFLRGAC